ncbi:MAG: hypothetical protein M3167_07590 [Acidobacteriota bacterium]|nr:hypothetical protein [Acidobacteriota bacterium]
MADKEKRVTSHWKLWICGVGLAAIVLAGCQKSESTGGASAAEPTVAPSTSAQAATGAAAPVGDTAKPPFGFLDTPKEGATVASGSWAYGWALDDSGIATITVASETGATAPVALGQPFPGVAQSYPGLPGADKAGFGFPVPKLEPGIHTLTITVTAKDGGKTDIRRQIRIR